MRWTLLLLLISSCFLFQVKAATPTPDQQSVISSFLDDFHRAAANADFDGYFSRFATEGIFMGTDAGERWTVSAFKDYARDSFSRGQGWTYLPLERHINISDQGEVAWFDEILTNTRLGRCRGTGVLTKVDGAWKISHYSLTLLIPNSIAAAVGEQSLRADLANRSPDEAP